MEPDLLNMAQEAMAHAAENASAAKPEYTTKATPIMVIEIALLFLMALCALAMIRVRRLFAVVMLSGIYSLLCAAFFVALDAVDVAFTEAAVGAGISTVLMLSGMLLTAKREKKVKTRRSYVALFVCVLVGAVLIYATIDMPAFGDPNAPANAYVGQLYLERTPTDMALPNVVTGVLASYRGFDTLGEVLVVFTAGLGVMLMLGIGSIKGGRKVVDESLDEELEKAATENVEDLDLQQAMEDSANSVEDGSMNSGGGAGASADSSALNGRIKNEVPS